MTPIIAAEAQYVVFTAAALETEKTRCLDPFVLHILGNGRQLSMPFADLEALREFLREFPPAALSVRAGDHEDAREIEAALGVVREMVH